MDISSGSQNMLNQCADLLAIAVLVVECIILEKIELGVIISNEQIIVPFDVQHIAGHVGPRHILSEERLLTVLRLALLADCTAFHHNLHVFIDVWPVHRLAHE